MNYQYLSKTIKLIENDRKWYYETSGISDYSKEDLEEAGKFLYDLEIHRMITDGTLEKPEYESSFRENNEIAVYSYDGTLLYKPVECPAFREDLTRALAFDFDQVFKDYEQMLFRRHI